MLYVFVSKDNELYANPDAYILSKKNQIVEWGDELKVFSVYRKGFPVIHDHQTMNVRFFHEGNSGSVDDSYWIGSDINNKSNTNVLKKYKVVYFNLGEKHPCYFLSKEDLCWYITNIYDLYQPFVNDEYPSDIEN